MKVKAKVCFTSPEVKKKVVSALREDGNFVEESKKDQAIFVTLVPGITKKSGFYIPEEIQEYDPKFLLTTEEILPVDGWSTVVCGAQSGVPLRPYYLQKDKMDGSVFAAYFNVPKSVSVVGLTSAKEVTVILYKTREDGSFVELETLEAYAGSISQAGKYIPPAKAALMKLQRQEGVCYFAPNAMDFYNSFN